jgi:hypothetical protein
MLKNLLLMALFWINTPVFAQLDTEFLSDELFRITNHGLKENVYVLHLAANDFGLMKPSELDINLKNIDKMLNNKSLVDNLSEEDLDAVESNFSSLLQAIYMDKDPEVNQAVTYNVKMKDYAFALIAVPNIYYEDYSDCAGAFILFQSFTCFQLDYNTKSFLTKYIKRNHVPTLDSDYLGNFIVVHEFAHTLPEQLKLDLPNFYNKITNPDVKKEMQLVAHYNEVYSDLYAGLRLLQKGYPVENLDQIIFMRNVSLFLSKDIVHYSTPYIHALKNINKKDYMLASSFEDMDKIINKIFFQVINSMNVMDENIFFVEKLEIYKDLADIATFAFSVNKDINKNTFQKKTPEQARFVNKLFTTFNNSIYLAKRRFLLDYRDKITEEDIKL